MVPGGPSYGGQVDERDVDAVDHTGIAQLDRPGRDRLDECLDDVRRHPIGRDRPQRLEVDQRDEDGPAGLAVPGRPKHGSRVGAVGLDERGDGLRADPGHPGRPEQRGGRLADLGPGQLDAPDHLTDRTGLDRAPAGRGSPRSR